ncbi:unnamed protein product [Arctogadus glacialis]
MKRGASMKPRLDGPPPQSAELEQSEGCLEHSSTALKEPLREGAGRAERQAQDGASLWSVRYPEGRSFCYIGTCLPINVSLTGSRGRTMKGRGSCPYSTGEHHRLHGPLGSPSHVFLLHCTV